MKADGDKTSDGDKTTDSDSDKDDNKGITSSGDTGGGFRRNLMFGGAAFMGSGLGPPTKAPKKTVVDSEDEFIDFKSYDL